MGIFDFFKKSSAKDGAPAGDSKDNKKVAGYGKVASDKRAQMYDRIDAIQVLAGIKTAEAATALLKRFSFSIDPSISDQEEKEIAFHGIVAAGTLSDLPKDEAARDAALASLKERQTQIIEAVRLSCEKAEQITWQLKVLRALLNDALFETQLLEILAQFDIEYTRNVEPKVQTIIALEGLKSEDIRVSIEPFLEDVNETVRFHAVETTFNQDNVECITALVSLLEKEESMRIKNKVAESFQKRGWRFPEEIRSRANAALKDTEAFSVNSEGEIVRRNNPFASF